MDGIFGKKNFKNEIVWRRYGSHNDARRRYGRVSDRILFYAYPKSTWNPQFLPLDKETIAQRYNLQDAAGKFTTSPLHARSLSGGGYEYTWRGITDIWKFPEHRLEELDADGRIYWPPKGNVPRRKVYLGESKGRPLSEIITDISIACGKERLGYPTQKPAALLDRIIRASCPDGGLVFDPFCGCGTTLHSAQSLNCRWIGADICVKACQVIEGRLKLHFDSLWDNIEFICMPKTRDDAKTLASLDAFRFERWAASLVDCMEANKKQRGDGGIDGRGRLAIRKGQFVDIVSQVKGGGTSPGDVQAFNGARQQAKADMGIFTCFEDRVTKGMRNAAASTGSFMDVPVVQIYTIEDFFIGLQPKMPRVA